MQISEFTDEYGDWLNGTPGRRRARWLDLTLSEMRHTEALRVAPSATIEEVIALMNKHHESAVLVVDQERLVGIFTERDVLLRVVTRVDGLFARVDEMMTRDPEALTESTLLSAALRQLAIGNYHHLPVVDAQGRAKAVVSLRTIIAFLADAFPNEILNAPPEHESYPPEEEGG